MTTMVITTKRLLMLLLAASSLFFSAPPLGTAAAPTPAAAAAPRPLPPPLAPSSPPPPPPPPPASPKKKNKTPEIGASVMLLGMYDWELISANTTNNTHTNNTNTNNTNTAPHHWSRCLDQLWRSTKRTNAKTVNFVVTHHWVPPPPSSPARTNARGAAAAPISQYCLMHGTDGRPKCYPWTDALVAELRDSLAVCFAEAMRMGLTVSVRPHLDDASPARAWRDALAFDPTANYGGFSYVDVMLNPVADALGIALAQTSAANAAAQHQQQQQTVYLSLQGEMGATVANYPARWAELAGAMRARVLQRAAASRVSKVASSSPSAKNNTPNVLIGLGINFTGLVKDAPSTGAASIPLFGWLLAPPPSSTRTTTPTTTASAAAVRALFNGDDDDDDDSKNNNTNNTNKTAATNNKKLDFLGISAYAPMSGPGFPLKELEAAAFNVADSLRTYGVDLKKLVEAGRIELHYSELGLGGAGRDSGGRPARSARDAAKAPWAGIDAALGNYLQALDPWRHEPLRLFALEFYTKLAAWLAAGDAIKTFPVSKVFIWSHNSFDVLGVYPESTNAQGSYLIPTVQKLIAAHNAKARGEEAEAE